MNNLTTGLVSVLFVAAGMLSIGIFAIAWRRWKETATWSGW